MHDILYPYQKGDCEMKYSLRSLENLPHGKVFIYGDLPENISAKKVHYIPFEHSGTKYKNTTAIMELAARNEEISDDFILMNDDFFVMQKIINPDEELNLYRGDALEVYKDYTDRYGKEANYAKGMLETIKFMQSLGIERPLSYELHTPMIFNKRKFLDMLNIKGVRDILALHKRSLYGNLYKQGGVAMEDVKIFTINPYTPPPDKKFISCSDTAWANLREYMQKFFNKKSIYEV